MFVIMLRGQLFYCADGDGNLLDAHYMLPYGGSINKTWYATLGPQTQPLNRWRPSEAALLLVHVWAQTSLSLGRCEQQPVATVNTSWYHSGINATVPAWNVTVGWTKTFRRFDNVFSALWVLFQVRARPAWPRWRPLVLRASHAHALRVCTCRSPR